MKYRACRMRRPLVEGHAPGPGRFEEPHFFSLSGSQRCASKYVRTRNSAAALRGGFWPSTGSRRLLTQARLANLPGEGSPLGPNRYSPEQSELVEQLASAVRDTGERIVTDRDREICRFV
jgi:hypothetical protein